jgi:hypothetical protein
VHLSTDFFSFIYFHQHKSIKSNHVVATGEVELVTHTVPVEKLLRILREMGRSASLQGLGGGASSTAPARSLACDAHHRDGLPRACVQRASSWDRQ